MPAQNVVAVIPPAERLPTEVLLSMEETKRVQAQAQVESDASANARAAEANAKKAAIELETLKFRIANNLPVV